MDKISKHIRVFSVLFISRVKFISMTSDTVAIKYHLHFNYEGDILCGRV